MDQGDGRFIAFSQKRLQHAYKHAPDFGIFTTMNKQSLLVFEKVIRRHVRSPATELLSGTYRNRPVVIFVNRFTRLAVIRDMKSEFLSGWRLSVMQLEHVLRIRKLGGGA